MVAGSRSEGAGRSGSTWERREGNLQSGCLKTPNKLETKGHYSNTIKATVDLASLQHNSERPRNSYVSKREAKLPTVTYI